MGRKVAGLGIDRRTNVRRVSTKACMQWNRLSNARKHLNFRPLVLLCRDIEIIYLTERNRERAFRCDTPEATHHVEQRLSRRHLCCGQAKQFAYPLAIDRKLGLDPLLPRIERCRSRCVLIEL